MSREKRLLAYFEKLNGLEKDILVGRAAELSQAGILHIDVKEEVNIDVMVEMMSKCGGNVLTVVEEPEVLQKEVLQRALQETMEIMLESELFTNAAKRGTEDYEVTVSRNIPAMVESVIGKYQMILCGSVSGEEDLCMQKVTRRGIKAEGKEYWSIELMARFLGKRVKVEIGETSISVSEPNGNPICTFEK